MTTEKPTRARRSRREMLQLTATGTAMLTSGLFGALWSTEAGAADLGAINPQNGKLRRVVSALNSDGKSFIAIDDSVDVGNLFSTPAGKVMGDPGKPEPAGGLTTASGKTRCFVAAIPPQTADKKPTRDNRIGYHKGDGISYCFILNGELTYMTDTQETVVRSGDLIVERATLHSWRNDSASPVSMFIVTVSAT